MMAEQYIGGSPKQFPGRYAATAAATHLGPNAPPAILFISENDHLVPPASMKAYEAASRRAGIETRGVHIPYGEHGFDLIGVGNAVIRQATLQFLAKTVPASHWHAAGELTAKRRISRLDRPVVAAISPSGGSSFPGRSGHFLKRTLA